MKSKSLSDYQKDAANWITLATGEYYPDILLPACELYKPVLVYFGELVKSSESSQSLFKNIMETKEGWMRIQLARVFRKYVSPETPVEMLKIKSKTETVLKDFGDGFRKINEVQRAFTSRPIPDEAICALLWEYKDRGKKGYDLTEKFFSIFREAHKKFSVFGPERAGKDILLSDIFPDYPNKNRPVDFIIKNKETVLAVGLARYDSDRGGAQEDDRTGGYKNCADEILNFAKQKKMNLKLIFLNDGPGLLLGSMWRDYISIENSWPNQIMVLTLRMIPDRLTENWLLNKM